MNDDALPPNGQDRFRRLRAVLRSLYHGSSPTAVRFRLGVIVVDLTIIAFFIGAPLIKDQGPIFYLLDYCIAALMIADVAARAMASPGLKSFLRRPIVWVDLFILATLLFPAWLANLGFLRVLRLWTLVESEFFWRTVGRRLDDTRYEELTKAIVRLVTFIFVITGFVYSSFMGRDVGIEGWIDALYFTVTSLTTTGYGDITLPGAWGRLLSIFVMLVGVSLFIRLMQLLVRPHKVNFPCPACGLSRHDPDAVHCKACGQILNIPNEE